MKASLFCSLNSASSDRSLLRAVWIFRVGPLDQVLGLVRERLAGRFHLDLRPLELGVIRLEALLHLLVFPLEPDVVLAQPLDERIADGLGHVVGADVLQPVPGRLLLGPLDLGLGQGLVELAQPVDDRRLVVAQGDDVGLGLEALELFLLLLDLGLEPLDLLREEGRRLLGRGVLHVDVEVDEGGGQVVDAVGRELGVAGRERDLDEPRQPHRPDREPLQEVVDEPLAEDVVGRIDGLLPLLRLADELRVLVELEPLDDGVGQAPAAQEPVLRLVEIVPHRLDLEDLLEREDVRLLLDEELGFGRVDGLLDEGPEGAEDEDAERDGEDGPLAPEEALPVIAEVDLLRFRDLVIRQLYLVPVLHLRLFYQKLSGTYTTSPS